MSEEINIATKVDEKGQISTNIGVQKAKKASNADANIKEAMGVLNKSIDTNKSKRDKALKGSIDNNDVLFDKMLWSLLEELLQALFMMKMQNFKDIAKELEKNEKLSKELILSQLRKSIDENNELTSENKELLQKKILSEHIQEDLLNIAQYKHNQNIKEAKDIVKKVQKLNPYAFKEEIAQAIDNELNLNMRGHEVFVALSSKFEPSNNVEFEKHVQESQENITHNIRKQ